MPPEGDIEGEYGQEEMAGEQSRGGELFTNNHDLIGVEGIIRAQKNEIEKKKVYYKFPNSFTVGAQN